MVGVACPPCRVGSVAPLWALFTYALSRDRMSRADASMASVPNVEGRYMSASAAAGA